MLQYAAIEIAVLGCIAATAGLSGLLFFLAQSFVAFSLLEAVNYVEHYGLERSYDGGGYEPVSRKHAWDSPRRLTNYLLINLQRNADHHTAPQRRYQTLRVSPEAPQLPAGYAEMVLLALLPRRWFRTMDPRLPEPPQ